mgnify:FL=1
MPPDLRDKLKAASEESHRSMNAEIVARLQESFEPGLSADTATTLVAGLQQALNEAREMQEEARRQREEAEVLLREARGKKGWTTSA